MVFELVEEWDVWLRVSTIILPAVSGRLRGDS